MEVERLELFNKGRDKMVNKKVVLVITIIVTILVCIIIGVKIESIEKAEYTFSEVDIEANEVNNISENSINENLTNNEEVTDKGIEQEPEEEKIENTSQQSSNIDSANTISVPSESNEQNVEQEAINLAKKNWGEDREQDVYYYVEEKLSEKIYVVSVRSKKTTATLIDYEVNLETGEVSEY